MRVYLPHNSLEKTSGIGKAITHQIEYLNNEGVECIFKPNKEYDLIHVNSIFDPKNLWIVEYHYLKKCPMIVHGHSTFQDFQKSYNFYKIVSWYIWLKLQYYYAKADFIITPTDYSKSIIMGYGLNNHVIALSNGIDVDLANQNVEENIKEFKNICKLNDSDKVVLGIGFPFERKGIEDFIEVARKFPQLKFVWCGHISNLINQRKIIKAIKNKPNNMIMPGFIPSSAVRGGMHFAKCFFFPSKEETEGIVVLEALACKCPLIIRDIGVYDYWLKDGYNCYKGTSIDDFVDCIHKVIYSNNAYLVENGYRVAEKRNKNYVSKQLASIYQKVIDEKANRKESIRKVR